MAETFNFDILKTAELRAALRDELQDSKNPDKTITDFCLENIPLRDMTKHTMIRFRAAEYICIVSRNVFNEKSPHVIVQIRDRGKCVNYQFNPTKLKNIVLTRKSAACKYDFSGLAENCIPHIRSIMINKFPDCEKLLRGIQKIDKCKVITAREKSHIAHNEFVAGRINDLILYSADLRNAHSV